MLILIAGCGERAPEPRQSPDQPDWAGPAAVEPSGKLDRSHAGGAAPAAEFEDPEGRPVRLADFGGKPLLVNLWATWCPPCVAEMPTLDALAGREGEKLEVLTVSEDLDGRAKVDDFFAKRKFVNLETYLDPQMGLMAELGISTLPTTILYDSQGREVWRVTGMEDWISGRAAALIAEANREAAR
jgi:thiol-disulfide isomerase/thioredoxin